MRTRPIVFLAMLTVLGFAPKAFCDVRPTPVPFAPPSDAFQVHYAANLNVGDSFINMTNGGTQGGTDPAGNICANVYVFEPDEQLAACCSCPVSPDGLVSLSVRNDLISNTLTPAVPNSVVVKLLATKAKGNSCSNSAATATASNLASGLVAWGTNLHALPTTPTTFGLTEEEFSFPQLSASELSSITSNCQFIVNNGSGFGICRSCRLGGL